MKQTSCHVGTNQPWSFFSWRRCMRYSFLSAKTWSGNLAIFFWIVTGSCLGRKLTWGQKKEWNHTIQGPREQSEIENISKASQEESKVEIKDTAYAFLAFTIDFFTLKICSRIPLTSRISRGSVSSWLAALPESEGLRQRPFTKRGVRNAARAERDAIWRVVSERNNSRFCETDEKDAQALTLE